jgi:hypothetical protein
LLSKLSQDLEITQAVYTLLILAKISQRMLIMQSLLLDMEMKMEKTTGSLKTHGVQLGVIKDSLRLKEV